MKATRDNNGQREVFFMDRGDMRFYFGSIVTFNRELRRLGDCTPIVVGRTHMNDDEWKTIPTAKVELHEDMLSDSNLQTTSQNEQPVSTH
jgi:hypothetical protein